MNFPLLEKKKGNKQKRLPPVEGSLFCLFIVSDGRCDTEVRVKLPAFILP